MTNPPDLVVGGSGMLSALCVRLSEAGRPVAVLARNSGRLEALAGKATPGHIIPVRADYRDALLVARVLDSLARSHGRPVRTICWIHDEAAPDALSQVADRVGGIFWHVLGSAACDPAQPQVLSGWRARFQARNPQLDYRQIVLGFVMEAGKSRWLTDAEISGGVYTAAENTDALNIVGIVGPWSRRPY
jgi:NAD(P)-dependent dehydrogenase (short-subunit alcohol dehydrogenase family)